MYFVRYKQMNQLDEMHDNIDGEQSLIGIGSLFNLIILKSCYRLVSESLTVEDAGFTLYTV